MKIIWKRYSKKEREETMSDCQCDYYLPLNDKNKTEYDCLRERNHKGNHRTTQPFLPVKTGKKVPYLSIDGDKLSHENFL